MRNFNRTITLNVSIKNLVCNLSVNKTSTLYLACEFTFHPDILWYFPNKTLAVFHSVTYKSLLGLCSLLLGFQATLVSLGSHYKRLMLLILLELTVKLARFLGKTVDLRFNDGSPKNLKDERKHMSGNGLSAPV